jgi:hypothetical protein
MADLCRVILAGHLSRDFERTVRPADGMVVASSELCVGRTALIAGYPVTTTTRIPVEVIGAAHVAAVSQQFGSGSRLLIEGHLELREENRVERWPAVHGGGDVLVKTSRAELVVVIDSVLNADVPQAAAEAASQPDSLWWDTDP